MRTLLKLLEIKDNDPRANRIEKLIEILAETIRATDPAKLRYQIHIIDRPHAITWKEFNVAFTIWTNTHDLIQIADWLSQHSKTVDSNIYESARELFDCVVGFRRRKLDDASSAIGSDEHEIHMKGSSDALELIDTLVQKGLPSLPSGFFCVPGSFAALWGMVEAWIHFRKNKSDLDARAREREVLIALAKLGTNNPVLFLEVVKPWDTHHSAIGEQERLMNDLARDLAKHIEPLVADLVLKRLSARGTLGVLWNRSAYLPEKWVLFNKDSPLWRGGRRERIMALLNQASRDESIHANALELIHLVSEGVAEGIGISYGTRMLTTLIQDTDISGSLWKAATARPVQYRSLSRVKAIRDQFTEICGTKEHLPIPGWMEAWDSESNAVPNGS